MVRVMNDGRNLSCVISMRREMMRAMAARERTRASQTSVPRNKKERGVPSKPRVG
jgi:hypothetical protein